MGGYHGEEIWSYDANHRVTEHKSWSSSNGRCRDSTIVTGFFYDAFGVLIREAATMSAGCSEPRVLTTTYTRPAPPTVIGETRDQAGVFVRRTRTVTDDLGMVTESDLDNDGNGFKRVFRRDYSCWKSSSGT